jgi:DNA-binding transcriptional LysR family regulator
MTLEQLKMLVKIADTGSVLAAAEALYRTQPTVSVAIRKLEDELGVPLLDRQQYRATLTVEGQQLCQKARTILKQTEDFSILAQHLAIGNEPQLHLAIEASCPMPLVLRLLRESEKKYPQTEFNLQVENIWGALEKVQNGEVDVAISPWFEELAGLESIPLTQTRLVTVAAPGFCPDEVELTMEQMKQYVQVVVRDSSRNPQQQKSYGVLTDGRHWIVGDHMTKKELILARMGWGKLHEHLIAEELAKGALVPLQISHYPCQITVEIRAVRRLGEPVGPVANALWRDFQALQQDLVGADR